MKPASLRLILLRLRREALRAAFAGAQFADAGHLSRRFLWRRPQLAFSSFPTARLSPKTHGRPSSSFSTARQSPGARWNAFHARRLSRCGRWHLRAYSVRFIRPLMIDQYQDTPGSGGLQFQPNPQLPVQLPAFVWKRAFSPVIRLSAVDLYHRGGGRLHRRPPRHARLGRQE